jgi:hypothetical protein
MSIRRRVGDIVVVRDGSDYRDAKCTDAGWAVLGCPMCDDPHCREWTALHDLNENGQKTGKIFRHVHECEMSDSLQEEKL